MNGDADTTRELLDALVPIFTILATGIVSVGGSWLLARMARQSERAKLEAEDRRERSRLEREDAAAARAAEAAEADAEAARSLKVAEYFLRTLQTIQEHDPERGDDARFDRYFALHWGPVNEIELRREIGTLTNGTLRSKLNNLVGSMTDGYMISYHGATEESWARWLCGSGADLALAASRKQDPDPEVEEKYDVFFGTFTDVWQMREEQREVERSSERREVLKDIAKQESLD